MNQEQANELIDKLGILVLLDAPEQIQLGIDNIQWVIGKKFKGIKLIPLGVHYVHYSLKSEQYQFKLGFFCLLSQQKRVIIKRWNEKYEDFLPLDEEDEELYIHSTEIGEFDHNLGPYPHEKWEVWCKVSNFITSDVLSKLDPISPQMFMIEDEYQSKEDKIQEEDPQNCQDCQLSNSDPESFNFDAEQSESQEQSKDKKNSKEKQTFLLLSYARKKKKGEKKEQFKIMAGTTYYTDIPQRLIKHGFIGEELTKLNFDKSTILKQLIEKEYSHNFKILLGELQYSFVKFLLGENYDSFEQWKKLFILVTSCEQYMNDNPQFFLDLIPVIYDQLQQIPKDFFVDPLAGNSFIKICLNNFFELCENLEGKQKNISKRAQKLKEMVKLVFIHEESKQKVSKKIIQNDEDDEEDPIIVEDFNFIQI